MTALPVRVGFIGLNGLVEVRELAALSEAKGVVAVAGTQARCGIEIENLRNWSPMDS